MALALLILPLLLLARAIYALDKLSKRNKELESRVTTAHNATGSLIAQSFLIQREVEGYKKHDKLRAEAYTELHARHSSLAKSYGKLKAVMFAAQYGGGPLAKSDGNGNTRVVLL